MENNETIYLDKSPREILNDPLINKGTAFTLKERESLGLIGMLPYHISTMEEQVKRRYENFISRRTSMGRYKMLTALQDRNEILFYRLVLEHVEEMLAYVYTPTVGEASLGFSLNYDQPRGIYIPYEQKDRLDDIIANLDKDEVEVIVVTDGSRILGLGDMGTGGMVIPVGKLILYTLFGGIDPRKVLPVLLDVGTNNEDLLNDPLYLGWSHPRIEGEEFFSFVNSFVKAVKNRYPNALLQWEDFSKEHAKKLLDTYQDKICSFNDDIQGTAATVLAGLYAAVKMLGSQLKEQKIVMLGGGSAGLGIVNLLVEGMVQEGCSLEEARKKIYIVDRPGLVHKGIEDFNLGHEEFAHELSEINKWNVKDKNHITLFETIDNAKPTILLGACAQPGIFTEEIIKQMYKHTKRPIIFPLSNPTSKAEAEPKNIIEWTEGNALVATGSPFPPFVYNKQEYHISQGNNVYIFPGVGLGAISVKAKQITSEMFLKAADVLSSYACKMKTKDSHLFPPFKELRNVSKEIAIAIGELAIQQGVASVSKDANVRSLVEENMWYPSYPTYLRAVSKES